MPKPLHYIDVADISDTCVARIHPNVGAVAQREFSVEVNLLRSYLIEIGHRKLLIEIQPTSGLNPDQFRGFVFLIREVRQRGVTAAFCGGGPHIQQTLGSFGMSQPADWFPSAIEALAAFSGIPAGTMMPAAPVSPAQYGAVPPVPYPVAPPQPYAAMYPQAYPTAPPQAYPGVPATPGGPATPPVPVSRPQATPAPARAAAPRPAGTAAAPRKPTGGWSPPPHGRYQQAHELTLRGHHRQPVLASAPACAHLAEQIRVVSNQFNFNVWAFVFMPDHFHLLVQSRQLNYDIGDYLEAIKQAFHEKGVEILGEHAPEVLGRLRRRQGSKFVYDFWQKTSGQNRNIDYSSPLRPLINHFHENPVRRGLVERATDWKWSSAGAYAGTPLAELRPDPVPPELLGS